MKALQVQMLGDFTISAGEAQISDRDNRSRKVWMLMAYLIYHRRRVVSQDELMNLLWGEDDQGVNPTGALKTMFYRARTTLDSLWPNAGHELILRKSGGYTWNDQIPLELDVEVFEKKSKAKAGQSDEALELYRGDFLSNMSSDTWVIPISAYYHNCYMQMLLQVLPEMMEQGRYNTVADLCRTASVLEPYHEQVHQYLMDALLRLGDQKGAANIYKKYSERLFANFGVLPEEKIRQLYYEAVKTINDHAISIEVLQDQLREDSDRKGALICEYDFFRVLYRSIARDMARSGIAAHIVLLTVTGPRGSELSQRKLKGAMDNLEDQVRISLRRGDAAAKCSASQYVLMLPRANYENSCMVCDRIIRAYYRQHPHSDADIQYAVCPLQPEANRF